MTLTFVAGLLLLITLSNGQEYTPGIRRNLETTRIINLLGRTTQTDMDTQCVGKMGPVCLNNILLTCIADKAFYNEDCKSINAAKPYCHKSACTNEKPEATSTDPFRCTSVGLFPNPNDCTSYYHCKTMTPLEVIPYVCKKNYVYDSKTGMCKLKRTSADCQTISCAKKSNQYQLFATDKSILAFCADISGNKETILFRCANYNEMEYDPITFECKYACTKEGNFAVPGAAPGAAAGGADEYYACYKDGSRFVSEKMKCTTGFSFDADRKECLVKTIS